jgi:hypothetical protein
MKKIVTAALLCVSTSLWADMYQHNLQVFTSNTMETPCHTTPKVLFFGKAEEASAFTKEEVNNIINNGISEAGNSLGSWFSSNGVSGRDLAAGFGAGMIGSFLGKLTLKAVYAVMDDPEYIMISECNSGNSYTRLITMVVSSEKMDLNVAKSYALADQKKMAKVVR